MSEMFPPGSGSASSPENSERRRYPAEVPRLLRAAVLVANRSTKMFASEYKFSTPFVFESGEFSDVRVDAAGKFIELSKSGFFKKKMLELQLSKIRIELVEREPVAPDGNIRIQIFTVEGDTITCQTSLRPPLLRPGDRVSGESLLTSEGQKKEARMKEVGFAAAKMESRDAFPDEVVMIERLLEKLGRQN